MWSIIEKLKNLPLINGTNLDVRWEKGQSMHVVDFKVPEVKKGATIAYSVLQHIERLGGYLCWNLVTHAHYGINFGGMSLFSNNFLYPFPLFQ